MARRATREREYNDILDARTTMRVRFIVEGTELRNYSVVLLHAPPGAETQIAVRVYDFAHGVHDEHLCTRTGAKRPARIFNNGSVQEGFEEARRLIRSDYTTMIETWLR